MSVWEKLSEKSQLQSSQQNLQKPQDKEIKITEIQIPEFKFEEEKQIYPKIVFTIYGDKGVGKTTLSFGFPGKIACLSFDRKSMAPKVNYYKNDPRIKVFDVVKFLNRDSKYVREASEITYNYVMFILDNLSKLDEKEKPDWVVIDGVEIMQKVAEYTMRLRQNLQPYQGVANLNVWKERNSLIDAIHQKALDACKVGVIYTTYSEFNEIVEEGTLITKQKVPKYIDSVMWETDIVLYIQSSFDMQTKQHKFTLRCDSSKFDDLIKTGSIIDITGKKISDVIDFSKIIKQSEGGET
jgi:hypothetical protein